MQGVRAAVAAVRAMNEIQTASRLATKAARDALQHVFSLEHGGAATNGTGVEAMQQHKMHAAFRDADRELHRLVDICAKGGAAFEFAALKQREVFARQVGWPRELVKDVLHRQAALFGDDAALRQAADETRECFDLVRDTVKICTESHASANDIRGHANRLKTFSAHDDRDACSRIISSLSLVLLAQHRDAVAQELRDAAQDSLARFETAGALRLCGSDQALSTDKQQVVLLRLAQYASALLACDDAQKCLQQDRKPSAKNMEDAELAVTKSLKCLRTDVASEGLHDVARPGVYVIEPLISLSRLSAHRGAGIEAEGLLTAAHDTARDACLSLEVLSQRDCDLGLTFPRIAQSAANVCEERARLYEKLSWNNVLRTREAQRDREIATKLQTLFPANTDKNASMLWYFDAVEAVSVFCGDNVSSVFYALDE